MDWGRTRGFLCVKSSDMRGGFDAMQVPPPGKPQVYRRDLEAKRKRSTQPQRPQSSETEGFGGLNYARLMLFCLEEITRNTKPRAKKTAREATAMLMVPPASLTQAMTAEPRKDAPLQKMS